jgi:dihydrofolate reductase
MYEVMSAWETFGTSDQPAFVRDFANIWGAAEKVVFSKSLATVTTARTRIERAFEPEAIRAMKSAASQDMTIGGPNLAAEAFKARLVDECHFFVAPIIVGGGTSAFPAGVRLTLSLQGERRFGNGMTYLHYRAAHGHVA